MPSTTDLKQLGERLHQRLLAGSSLTVTNEIAENFLRPVARSLGREFSQISDHHLIDSAAEDSLVYYFDHPAQYDPSRSSLFTFLRLRAKGFMLNSLGRQKNLAVAEKVVELDSTDIVYEVEAPDESAETAFIERESESKIVGQLREIITDPTDFQVVMLMLDGVRNTRAFAEVLGVADLSEAEQAILVKRAKDRLKKTVQRKFQRGDRQL